MRQCKLRKLYKNPLAFSLVELAVVIALMSILAAAVMPAIKKGLTETTDAELTTYFDAVRSQMGLIKTTYDNATKVGNTPRLAGYDLSTARGMQECLRSANNHSDLFDIEVTTINEAPDPYNYNYIDTIVICVQFYVKNATTPITNSAGLPCSPEQAVSGVEPYRCQVTRLWYVKKDVKNKIFKQGGIKTT